jgi:outer membrane protein assembly factor BamB
VRRANLIIHFEGAAMRMRSTLAAMVFGACSFFGAAQADTPQDWPQFHGANRDNISRETGLLKVWPEGGPPLAWKIQGIGAGYSTVSVANGVIYTAGEEDQTYVYALKESDGSRIWRSPLGSASSPGGFKGTRSTPTVDGNRVYMISQNSDVVCYEAADGKEVWRKHLNKNFGGNMMSGWGNSESVLVDGENLICTPGGNGGTLLALSKADGREVWRSKDLKDSAAYASPIAVEIGGVRQIIVYTDRSLAGIAAADGKLLWRHDRPGKTAVIPTPVVKDNYIFVTSGYKVGCDLFKINAEGGTFKAEKVYSNKDMENHHGGVILLDGKVYGHSGNGGWTCMDMMSGEVIWRGGKLGKGTIAYADGRFVCREEGGNGDIVLIEASPAGWKEHGRFKQPDRSRKEMWPHIVIANGKMYIRDQATLLCYDVKAK